MTYKALNNGEGGGATSGKRKPEHKDADSSSDLGALKLDAGEIAIFEKWAMEANPTKFMLEAAKRHRALQLKLKR